MNDAQEDLDFYATVLGMRLVKKTVNSLIRATVGEPGLSVGIVASIQIYVKSNIEYPTRNLE